ncbi:hypothetical protein [Lacticaseibacillus suihuaensis]
MKPLKRLLLLGTAALGLILTACGKPVADRVPGVDQMSYSISGKDDTGHKSTISIQLKDDHTFESMTVSRISRPDYPEGDRQFILVDFQTGRMSGHGRHLKLTPSWGGEYSCPVIKGKKYPKAAELTGQYADKKRPKSFTMTFDKKYQLTDISDAPIPKHYIGKPSASQLPSVKKQYLKLAHKYLDVANSSYSLEWGNQSTVSFTKDRFRMIVITQPDGAPEAWHNVAVAGGDLSSLGELGHNQAMAEGKYHLDLMTGKLTMTTTRVSDEYDYVRGKFYGQKKSAEESDGMTTSTDRETVTNNSRIFHADRLKKFVRLPQIKSWEADLQHKALPKPEVALPPHDQAIPTNAWQDLFLGIDPAVEQNSSHQLRKKDAAKSSFKGNDEDFTWKIAEGGSYRKSKVVNAWQDNDNILVELKDDNGDHFKILLSDIQYRNVSISSYKLTYAGRSAQFGPKAGKYSGTKYVPSAFADADSYLQTQ